MRAPRLPPVSTRRRRARAGFTLLEVMVAVAILGLGLTAILSAQAGAFASASHARALGAATSLGRCKMTELEEHLGKDGLPALDENESGPCCDGDDSPNVKCSWKIEKPQLPEPKLGELDLDSSLDTGGPLALLDNAEKGKSVLDADAGASLASQLAGGGAAGADMGGMISGLMNLVYPDLKSLFEASARRITVTTTWTEGSKEYSLELVQWVTVPQQGMLGEVEGEFDTAEADTGTGTSGTTGGRMSPGGTGRTPGGSGTSRPGGGGKSPGGMIPGGGGKRP